MNDRTQLWLGIALVILGFGMILVPLLLGIH